MGSEGSVVRLNSCWYSEKSKWAVDPLPVKAGGICVSMPQCTSSFAHRERPILCSVGV